MTLASELHTLIIGAGPSGIAAAHRLASAGMKPIVVEKTDTFGGLMRSISHGQFILDIGRKELYTRIAEVDALWHETLGSDYRRYPHRVGSLYRGRILELSSGPRGPLRGVPVPWLLTGGVDLAASWVLAGVNKPANYRDYWYRRAGGRFTRLFAQGYWEKFRGQAWSEMPVPKCDVDGSMVNSYSFNAVQQGIILGASFNAVKQGFILAARGGPSTQKEWRHPARGTGQICERLLTQMLERGGEVRYETEVTALQTAGGEIVGVETMSARGREMLRPRQVISSLAIEALAENLLGTAIARPPQSSLADAERTVCLVYLFFAEPPRFPHAWLEVNDTTLKSGRITNYAAFNGEMVPSGSTCLCVEFFCVGDDPLLALTEGEMEALAIRECAENGLIDVAQLTDTLQLRLRRANAAASWRDWQSRYKVELLDEVRRYGNLFHVNRPGTDWATFAGLMAAEAILDGSRADFDRRADPTRKYEPEKTALRP